MSGFTVLVRRPDRSVAGSILFDEFTMVERFCDVGRWTMRTSDAAMVGEFASRGAGIVVRRNGANLFSGPVDYLQREYRDGALTWVLAGPDDTHLLADVLAWPKPGSAVTAQTDAYDKRNGAAETVMKAYVTANAVTRLGLPLTVPTSQGRGSSRTWRARFTNLLELAQTIAASTAGLGFRIVQGDDRDLDLIVYQGTDLTAQGGLFSDETGTTLEWTYTEEWPQATRVIVGGGDQAADRWFRQYTSSSRETAWARVIEQFKDRRDIDPDDDTATDEMAEEGTTFLADSSEVQSFRLSVNDTPGLEYGTDYRVGDLVRAYPAGVQVDDRITEATITLSDQGEQVSMWVGRKDDDPDERAERRARDLSRRLRQLERAY